MKTVIIDDERDSIAVIKTLIAKYCRSLEVVASFNDPREGLEYLRTNDVDLLFLDIQMPFMTGLELLKKVPDPEFDVIFVTAYDEYAIEAIKLSALDYLLKPIDPELLIDAVSKYTRQRSSRTSTEQIIPEKQATKVLTIQLQDKTLFLQPAEICYLKADSNYTDIYMMNKTRYTTSKTIKYFQSQLSGHHFFRPHQSFLVNTSYIQEYLKSDHSVCLKDGTTIPVSKNKKDDLLKFLSAG